MAARIAQRAFGVIETGGVITQATLYTLRNASGVTASVTDFGATLQSLMLPDRSGSVADCVLGFDDVSGYADAGTPCAPSPKPRPIPPPLPPASSPHPPSPSSARPPPPP